MSDESDHDPTIPQQKNQRTPINNDTQIGGGERSANLQDTSPKLELRAITHQILECSVPYCPMTYTSRSNRNRQYRTYPSWSCMSRSETRREISVYRSEKSLALRHSTSSDQTRSTSCPPDDTFKGFNLDYVVRIAQRKEC
jgi:hypothetical protein